MRDQLTRRQFLHSSAIGLGGLLAAGCARQSETADTAAVATRAPAAGGAPDSAAGSRVGHIGVQLYTVRNLMQQDMAGTLKSIADIGYREVEFAGYYDKTPQQVRAMLDGLGLAAPSAHVQLDAMRANTAQVLDAATAIGHRYVIVPFLQAPTTADAWSRLGEEFNRFGTAAQQRGIQFAYHNHDFEFKPVEGKLPYDLLLQASDPNLVKMQMDLFWAVKAGQDPLAYFERHPGRFPLVHVKDMRDLRGAQQMTEVGAGDIDFRRIFAQAGRAGLVHYVVEHDNPADALASIRTSYGNLRRMLA